MNFKSFTIEITRRYVEDHIGLIDSSIISTILGWVRSREIAKLSTCSDHFPTAYSSVGNVRFLRQVAAFFKKNTAFSDPLVCTPAAHKAFEHAERLCRITNRRLDHFYEHPDRIDPELLSDVLRTQYIISDVLGPVGDLTARLPELVRITAGATSTLSRRQSLPPLKLRFKEMPATRKAQPYLHALASYYGYESVTFRSVLTNRVETVPKNWKTDRTIACEPTGNLILQLALDEFIKERLKQKLKVDLSDQSKNQRLAMLGSLGESYVTLDLSMASDTMSFNALAWLLPRDWFEYARDARTPCGRGFGRLYEYAKFSSMGNGATFTLETLVFAAFCKAAGATRWNVYGDDLIVERKDVHRLVRLLAFFGFRLNHDKSFTEGPFRESCGADWFAGVDVTPVYLRDGLSLKSEDCHNVNTLASIAFPEGRLAKFLSDFVAERALPFVPFTESSISGVWLDARSAYSAKVIRKRKTVIGIDPNQLEFKAFVPQARSLRLDDSRSLFLWHLDANRRLTRPVGLFQHGLKSEWHEDAVRTKSVLGDSCIIRSRIPVFTHKYRRKWVCWIPPTVATPEHLYWWSDYLTRRKAG